jgi:hypothetical protein
MFDGAPKARFGFSAPPPVINLNFGQEQAAGRSVESSLTAAFALLNECSTSRPIYRIWGRFQTLSQSRFGSSVLAGL